MKAFNKEKALKNINRNKNRKQRIQYLALVFSCTAMIVSIMFFAFAKFENKQEYTLIQGQIGEFQSGDYIIGSYLDGVKDDTIPAKDGGYYFEKVECDNDATATWDSINWELTVSNGSEQTKCFIYFTTNSALADTTGNYSTTLRNYPVDSIYVSTDSTNPGTVFGGTWESYGSGRVLVGVDTSQTEFNTVSKTGGEKTHKLTTTEMPSHDHGANVLPITSAGRSTNTSDVFSMRGVNKSVWLENYSTNTEKVSKTGGGGAHNNLQPYITVYMWRRTA